MTHVFSLVLQHSPLSTAYLHKVRPTFMKTLRVSEGFSAKFAVGAVWVAAEVCYRRRERRPIRQVLQANGSIITSDCGCHLAVSHLEWCFSSMPISFIRVARQVECRKSKYVDIGMMSYLESNNDRRASLEGQVTLHCSSCSQPRSS